MDDVTAAGPAKQARRRDAARNRVAILEVAHALLSESPTVSMNEIGKKAGVGAGTLYRHFPTREDLILAVYRHDIRRLVDSVDAMLVEHAPIDAFKYWFDTLADYIRVKHGLGEALHSAAIQNAIDETYAPVVDAVRLLLDACASSGEFRPDLDPADVLLLMGFLWRVGPTADGRDQGRRVTEMVLTGLRVGPDNGNK
ncbi:TetR/AcrR family transcriptional regulator [Rhodococcus sp. NPDC057297]|jgi:AcrR family transcriptional regulator|uniref:TetR/AcrR family transcriptional regulator n=1 Tax=Rhodococcus sp. NPDC057297 TaxID=3346090 RepID=UPI00362DFD37